MEFYCYILYSSSLKKFYIGSTSVDVVTRLEQHNSSFYGNKKFTHQVSDWELFLSISCSSRKQCEQVEKHIKSMKSSKYISNLKLYPEMVSKLLHNFRDA